MAKTASGPEYLKVDYSAEPGHYPGGGRVDMVVAAHLQQARPGNVQHALVVVDHVQARDRTMLTKEIVVGQPALPQAGPGGAGWRSPCATRPSCRQATRLRASLALWRGSPDNCLDLTCLFPGRTLIGATKINIIPAQDQRDVLFLFK
jgi:hypothetical protein